MNQAQNWLKQKSKLGPFFLFEQKTYYHAPNGEQEYVLVWNDRRSGKTKIGSVHDGMLTRYGFNTWATLDGDTPFDTWGQPSEPAFNAMLEVRQGRSKLPIFNLHDIKDVKS